MSSHMIDMCHQKGHVIRICSVTNSLFMSEVQSFESDFNTLKLKCLFFSCYIIIPVSPVSPSAARASPLTRSLFPLLDALLISLHLDPAATRSVKCAPQ